MMIMMMMKTCMMMTTLRPVLPRQRMSTDWLCKILLAVKHGLRCEASIHETIVQVNNTTEKLMLTWIDKILPNSINPNFNFKLDLALCLALFFNLAITQPPTH